MSAYNFTTKRHKHNLSGKIWYNILFNLVIVIGMRRYSGIFSGLVVNIFIIQCVVVIVQICSWRFQALRTHWTSVRSGWTSSSCWSLWHSNVIYTSRLSIGHSGLTGTLVSAHLKRNYILTISCALQPMSIYVSLSTETHALLWGNSIRTHL